MTLTPQHYAMLHDASAIRDDVITSRGYLSLEHPDDLRDLGFNKSQSRTAPALAIPLWNVHGKQTGWQIRPDSPRIARKDGRVIKYENPDGSRVMLDVHPNVQPLLGKLSEPLWITEGVRKGDALVSQGQCTIAFMGGVWGFKGTNEHGGKVVLPDWQHIALNGRLVYVVFDSDIHFKPHVEKALKALYLFLRERQALPGLVHWPDDFQQTKWGVDDFFAHGHTLDELRAMVPPMGPLPTIYHTRRNGTGPTSPDSTLSWQSAYSRTKGGEVKETFANLVLTFQHISPWDSQCWYDVVKELPMCATESLSDAMVGQAALDLEHNAGIAIRTLRLVHAALVHHCRAQPHDPLQEWLATLPPWDSVPRLTEWLADHAGAPHTAYGMDISRLLPVSMVARALDPGCQYRNVIILEGPENLGKSKLVKALASPPWYRELSHGLEGKESHMILQGVWLAELAELSSLSKTADARLKSFITMERDDYIPKFANASVSRLRRTIFVGTVNPEGEGTYLRGQTGNTRFLPIVVTNIHVDDVIAIREQLFAEALVYYQAHPTDWWQLSSDGEAEAQKEREGRRQGSIYENSLRDWLQGRTETTWEEIAQYYLLLEAKEKWKDRGLQMEIAKAFRALKWTGKQQWRDGKNVRMWLKERGDSSNLVEGC